MEKSFQKTIVDLFEIINQIKSSTILFNLDIKQIGYLTVIALTKSHLILKNNERK